MTSDFEPQASQLYLDPPFHYQREDELVVTYPTEPEAARRWVPADMELDGAPKALVRFVRQRYSPFGGYTGAYVSVLGHWRGTRVAYMLVGAKNGFAGTAAGRELWAMPLTLADVEMRWCEDRLVAGVVDATGRQVVNVVANLQRPIDVQKFGSSAVAEGLFLRRPAGRNGRSTLIRTVHTAEGSAPPDSAWSAAVSVSLQPGAAREPWDALPMTGAPRGSYVVGGRSVLDYGDEFEVDGSQ